MSKGSKRVSIRLTQEQIGILDDLNDCLANKKDRSMIISGLIDEAIVKHTKKPLKCVGQKAPISASGVRQIKNKVTFRISEQQNIWLVDQKQPISKTITHLIDNWMNYQLGVIRKINEKDVVSTELPQWILDDEEDMF